MTFPTNTPAPTWPDFPGLSLLPGLDISIAWRPKFQNFKPQVAASGRETIVGASNYPLHEFDFIFNVLRNRTPTELEFKTLMGFVLQCQGTLNPFYLDNGFDNAVLAQPVGNTDNVSTTWLLTRTFGANGYAGSEPVGIVNNSQPFQLYIDGVAKADTDATYGYSLNLSVPWAQELVFTSAPPAGHAITVDMGYLYFCRLADDYTEFTQELFNVFSNKKLSVVTRKGVN